jgi:mRNA (2'-O-methyladenosine-N6-)-methyltransferase
MRALELGRDCLRKWGYNQVDELVWVKITPQNKITRGGKTGHWLNHSKEHCLVGIKGDCSKINKNVDCDVLITQVRETSRKPDEIYDLIERMVPAGRKCELFARPHNRRKGWVSLGNQLPGVSLYEQQMIDKFIKKYPNLNLD